ncbi:MAG: chromosome segregation protein SMC, partial [Oscillospiraceae bacterium]|nr:chromosome segregation protein SMC [Oscillospiraceae bacterium]
VLDNSEGLFPGVDSSEVMVTRRYYRSGESEYYINKQSVRLKDINELFMDTGLGREGYSIIGQGKIDEILSAKSGERREIFEEAAGISKFRHRKEETERKLERTEENLVRINDKISELELQVEPLREQAEKAKKYLIFRDELRVLEISVWLENLDKIRTDVIKLDTDFALAEKELDKAKEDLEALYAANDAFSSRAQENELAQEGLRGEINELDSRINEQESAIALRRSSMENNLANIRRMEQELLNQSGRTGDLNDKITAQLARIEELGERSAAVEEELSALLAEAEEAARKSGEADDAVESLRAKEALSLAAAADTRSEIAALRSGIREMDERRTKLAEESESVEEQLSATRKEARQSARALEEAEEEAAAIRNIIEGHNLKMEGRSKRAQEAEDLRVSLAMEKNNLASRIHLLSEMEKEYEGFNKAVKGLMQAAEKNTLRGIHGPVANLMTVDKKYAVAIEIALGAGMQNVVVDREEDAKAGIQFLKQRDQGRATFLPLSAIRGEKMNSRNAESEYGYVGVASDLLHFDKKYENIFTNLLGRTVIVEDLDCGIAMARKFQNAFRIVTLDGQVINRGGSMTGGSVSRSAGILSRANELKELTAKAAQVEQKLAAAQREADEAKRELTAAQYEVDVAAAQQREAENAVLKLQGEKNHYDILLGALRDRSESMEQEMSDLLRRRSENEKAITEKESLAAAQEGEAVGFRAAAEQLLSGRSEAQEHSTRLADAITEKKSLLAGFSAEQATMEENLGALRTLAEQMGLDAQEREALIESYRGANAAAETEIEAFRKAADAIAEEKSAKRAALDELVQAKLELEAERNQSERRARECNDLVISTQLAASKLEQKRSAAAMEEKVILDKLWEFYELGHSAAQAQRIELESLAKANRRIGELKREINSLGNVNVGAIEEFERVNTRYSYLTDQRDDVEKAKDELLGIIENITGEMTGIFRRQFELIRTSFQETFLELFGGGKATLELEDENNVLDCGIEIKVQPPGKALKTITLLSGGEKAFVAIALYFAILKVHPTPFCVMDEIEAALDEPNVIRVANYMRRICDKTQFIVITHRRGTMEAADVLYGVTMQEQGVSKVLTINMNDMARELNIKE